MTIWGFQQKITTRLLRINLLNIYLGTRLIKRGGFWGSVGSQAIGWGLINVAIAVLGRTFTRRRLRSIENSHHPDIIQKETRSLRRIFLINIPLNLVYMWGGKQLAVQYGKKDAVVRGHGWGIIIQGALLFIFDTFHFLSISSRKKHRRDITPRPSE